MIKFMFLKRPYYVYILLLIPMFFNLWWQYSVNNIEESVFTGFCIGTVLNSWLFCNFQHTQADRYTAVILENIDLKHDLLMAKMPHLAQSIKSDSLD